MLNHFPIFGLTSFHLGLFGDRITHSFFTFWKLSWPLIPQLTTPTKKHGRRSSYLVWAFFIFPGRKFGITENSSWGWFTAIMSRAISRRFLVPSGMSCNRFLQAWCSRSFFPTSPRFPQGPFLRCFSLWQERCVGAIFHPAWQEQHRLFFLIVRSLTKSIFPASLSPSLSSLWTLSDSLCS